MDSRHAAPVFVALDDYEGEWSRQLAAHRWSRPVTVRVLREHVPWPALADAIRDAQILGLTRERTPVTAEMVAALPALRAISQTGTGLAHLDLAALAARGVTVMNTPGGGAEAVAELALLLMLMLAREVRTLTDILAQGAWRQPLTRALVRKTLGIVGLGQIGTKMAALGNALGMTVLAWGPTLDPERARQHGATWVPVEDLFSRSDFVSLHLRLNDATRGLVGPALLDRMKPTACLINTARGGLVDMQHLRRMLLEGRIGGVGLDVFDIEPLPPDDVLRRHPRVVATPHVGWIADEVLATYVGQAIANVEQLLARWEAEGR
ncbi:MAG: D-2-hydroxyacid dehydrogenase family protein [Actinomycetia bacterium]|nr:D-2-hydroxyacid dehydrogenase family protein [Actinomycetes bacterium]